MGRPKLSDEQKRERLEKRLAEGGGDNRDSIRIYFTPLQYGRLKDYHRQGGGLPGETIRLALDAYMRGMIESGEYVPSELGTPEGAREAWLQRNAKGGKNKGEDKEEMSMDDERVGEDK